MFFLNSKDKNEILKNSSKEKNILNKKRLSFSNLSLSNFEAE